MFITVNNMTKQNNKYTLSHHFCLSAMFMLGGFAWFAAKAKDHFAYSFYLAVVAFVLHVVVAIVGGLQMNRSIA